VDDRAPPAPQPAEVAEAPPHDQLNGVFYKLFLFSVSADRNTTQRNSTQLEEHNITKLQTAMQQAVELVDRPKTPRKNLVKKRCRYSQSRRG